MTSGSAAVTAASATSDMRSAGAADALLLTARPRLPGVTLHLHILDTKRESCDEEKK